MRRYFTLLGAGTEDGDGGQVAADQRGYFDDLRAYRCLARTELRHGFPIDVNTRTAGKHQEVLITAKQQRFVLHTWTVGRPETDLWVEVDRKDARDWLLFNGHDNVVSSEFGDFGEGAERRQRGPGRPRIGGLVEASIGDDLVPRVQAYARHHGLDRSAAIRKLVTVGLDHVEA